MIDASTITPPRDEAELLQRAYSLAGLSFADLAQQQRQILPTSLHHAKGWLGQQLEQRLGANAGNQAQPDFVQLGIELKTIPLRHDGKPKETTYVCTVPLQHTTEISWRDSWVCRKLRRVLWLPYEADPHTPLAQRRLGTAMLWSPTPDDEKILSQDWEEIMELVCTGRIDEVSATLGQYLQVRPKAANQHVLTQTTNREGETVSTLPRGFYLRTHFTARILHSHYA